jgi:deazaflavin-dependent oxidoreductase (nitroreductase family)
MRVSKKGGDRPPRPSWLRSRLAKWALVLYRLGLGFLVAKQVLVLTTKGRVSGKERKTPLWYVRDQDTIYCVSGWGPSSDWWRNLAADPSAMLQMGKARWKTRGVPIHDLPQQDKILNLFLKKHGRLTRLFYHRERLSVVAFLLPIQGQR